MADWHARTSYRTNYPMSTYLHLPDGFYLPDEHDIFPILLPAELQRRVLFADAMRWFGFPRNWRRSQDLDVVAKYVRLKAASITRRFDLIPRRLDSLAAAVVRICTGNLASGRTQAGFSVIQASRGRMSGVARRRRTAARDEGDRQGSQAGRHDQRRGEGVELGAFDRSEYPATRALFLGGDEPKFYQQTWSTRR